jgi:predicted SprT family Zn-dependent metalloprotease
LILWWIICILWYQQQQRIMTVSEKKQFLQNLYPQILEEHSLPPIPLKFSARLKRALGQFKYYKNGAALSITISSNYMELAPIELLEDTLRHEIAHFMDFMDRGYSDHSQRWKRCAIKVGANPNRVKDLPLEFKPKGKIEAHCERCGLVGYRHRETKSMYYATYTHNKCGGNITFIKK